MWHRYRFLSFEFIHFSQIFSDNPTYKCMTLYKIIYEKKRRELHICQLYCRVPPVSDKMGSLLEQDPTEKWLKSTYRPQSDYLIQLRVFLTLDICVILLLNFCNTGSF